MTIEVVVIVEDLVLRIYAKQLCGRRCALLILRLVGQKKKVSITDRNARHQTFLLVKNVENEKITFSKSREAGFQGLFVHDRICAIFGAPTVGGGGPAPPVLRGDANVKIIPNGRFKRIYASSVIAENIGRRCRIARPLRQAINFSVVRNTSFPDCSAPTFRSVLSPRGTSSAPKSSRSYTACRPIRSCDCALFGASVGWITRKL